MLKFDWFLSKPELMNRRFTQRDYSNTETDNLHP